MSKEKKIHISTYLNRCNAPAGKLLIRARRALQMMPSKVAHRIVKDIEDYLGILNLPDNENHP